ncbi:uncharacterized protein zbbx isoform X1 [Channa argus]|uniref:uncharacterized protein zbbx isoform X1 n=2 Tax=Channa argus TaxID=215402 RepID=UPI003520D377
MNLNDNNKAKAVKLNARNLQQLKMETVTLAQESKEMEEKLQQLKESMSKEKEERGHSEGFRWKSGQCGSLNTNSITNSTKNNMENRLQKLSAGRVKIRVLKDEPLTASPRPLPPPLAPTTSLRTVRKNSLRGTICGQCEVKTAGLMCAECTENFCIGCFAKFHQKGALKLHRMIPIQTNLQTHVSTPDVINCSQKRIDHSLLPGPFTNLVPSPDFKSRCNPHHNFTSSTSPRNGDQNPEEGLKDVSQAMPFYPDPSQVLVMNRLGEKKAEVKEEGLKKKKEEDFPMSLLRGQYSEEESARSFQKALKQWRGEKSHPTGEPTCDSGMWKPVRRVSAIATQVDLRPNREIGDGLVVRIPVKVKFMENSLTYMDRLLLKQQRRTPIEAFTLGLSKDLKFLSNTYAEEETANSLTAQEEDFRQYCSSLFAVPISRSGTEPQITTSESCLVIQVLDDTNRDINGLFAAVQRTDSNQNFPYVQWVSSTGRTLVPQRSLTSSGSSSISSPSIPTQRSGKSTIEAQTKAAQRLDPFNPQTSQAEHLLTLMPSKSKTPACPTVETPRTSKTSIKTPNLKSQKPNFSPTVQKTKADLESPQPLLTRSLLDCQTKITKFSHSLPLFSPDISPVHKDSSLLPEQTLEPDSSELLSEPITSAKLSQFRLTSLEIMSQSQHCLSSKPDLQQKYLESNSSSDLSLFNESTSPYEHSSVFMSFTPITSDHEPTRSNHFFPSLTSQLLNNIHIPMTAVKEEDVLSIGK